VSLQCLCVVSRMVDALIPRTGKVWPHLCTGLAPQHQDGQADYEDDTADICTLEIQEGLLLQFTSENRLDSVLFGGGSPFLFYSGLQLIGHGSPALEGAIIYSVHQPKVSHNPEIPHRHTQSSPSQM
jgi:hypothetical protein